MARGVRRSDTFHKSDREYLEYTEKFLQRRVEEERITDDDAALLREWIAEIGGNIGGGRRYKIVMQTANLRRCMPPFRDATVTDLYTCRDWIRTATKEGDKPLFAQNTQADMLRFMRRFYFWLIDEGYSTIPHRKVEGIKAPSYQRVTKSAEQMLTEDEVRAILDAAKTQRDRALIATLYESGCRIIELGTLTWDQLKFTKWNVALNTRKKTGKPRYIPLVTARPYLAAWRAAYPGDPYGQNPVFLTARKDPLKYEGVAKQLKQIAARAGVKKNVTPHIFRHSRITHLIRGGMSESVIKLMMWGNLSTDMFETYTHLIGNDIDKAVAEFAGVQQPELIERSDAMEARQCPQCFSVAGPTMSFCPECGTSLTKDAQTTEVAMHESIANDPDALQTLIDQRVAEALKARIK